MTAMPEFRPVSTMPDLCVLDEFEIAAGYFSGLRGGPEPLASTVSRSYWHGWRNGAVDGGHRPKDADQDLLAHAYTLGLSCSARASDPLIEPPGLPWQ